MTRLPIDPIESARLATLKLLTVFTVDQMIQLAEAAVVTRDNAVIRKCSQSFQVEMNDKGYVRYFHYHQSVEAVKPSTYKAE
jgi:hypothetical protein